jgi:hypothetical protein
MSKKRKPDRMGLLTHHSSVKETLMDWNKLNLPDPRNPRPQVGELGTLDYWKLVVVGKLIKKSLAANLQTAVYTYISRTWEEHEKRLIVEANKAGISTEEMFMRLVEEEMGGKP